MPRRKGPADRVKTELVQFRVSGSIKARLDALADAEDESVSVIARRALMRYLASVDAAEASSAGAEARRPADNENRAEVLRAAEEAEGSGYMGTARREARGKPD